VVEVMFASRPGRKPAASIADRWVTVHVDITSGAANDFGGPGAGCVRRTLDRKHGLRWMLSVMQGLELLGEVIVRSREPMVEAKKVQPGWGAECFRPN